MKEGQPKPEKMLKKMPTKAQLESFIGGMMGKPNTIVFNQKEGKFIDLRKPKK